MKLQYILTAIFLALICIPEKAQAEDRQIKCIAEAVYHEANAESEAGKIAVANVVVNRMNDGRYPKTACGVVYQGCQFSWVCTKKRIINTYRLPLDIARKVYYRNIKDNTSGALFFHNKSVKPSWSFRLKKTVQIGGHTFYR